MLKHKRQDKFYDTAAWRTLRKQILARDGYRCVVCGAALGKGQYRIDHIIPMKQAPHLALEPRNLRSLCSRCDGQSHQERGTGSTVRIERFNLGHDQYGNPRDPNHEWNTTLGGGIAQKPPV